MKVFLSFLFSGLMMLAVAQTDSLRTSKLGQLGYSSTLNDVWGYVDDTGKEYALVGSTTGFSIVDVSNPSNPTEMLFIPGAISTWRDIKTYSHYAYVVHDGFFGVTDGILIIDMDSIGQVNPKYKSFIPTIDVAGLPITYRRSHNIYIDDKAVLHVYGAAGIDTSGLNTGIGVGGALFFDLAVDPENPAYLGMYDEYYLHDGMARGDTLFGGAVLNGLFTMIDISDKANPVTIGAITTPNAFTHNAWVSDDGKSVYTTDEVGGAFVTAYDITNPSSITELDRIQTSYGGGGVIPHNAHVYNDFIVTSYYTSGLQIVDAKLPNVLIETAYYDTSPNTGGGFSGAWGAYPYLPSGNILVTDMQEGLFVLSSDYPRACYLTGLVKDSVTGNNIANAQIEILTTSVNITSSIFGDFATGVRNSGVYDVVFSKAGYKNDTLSISLTNGVEAKRTVALLPLNFSIVEKALSNIEILPNPSKDVFTIELDETTVGGMAKLQLISINGQIVLDMEIDMASKKHTIQHNLRAGSYTLNLFSKDFSFQPAKLLVIE